MASDEDKAAARERYLTAYDHYKQLNSMISDRVGLPPLPTPLVTDESAGSAVSPASPNAMKAANLIDSGQATMQDVETSTKLSPQEKAEVRALMQMRQKTNAFGDSVAAQLYNYKK